MSSDIIALLDDEGIEKATLLGHSLGGRLACMTALKHRDRIHSLVVADVAPVAYDPDSTALKGVRDIVCLVHTKRATTNGIAD
jgi:esterase